MEELTNTYNWKTLGTISKSGISKVYKIKKENGVISVVKKFSIPISDEDIAKLVKTKKINSAQDANQYCMSLINNEINIQNMLLNENNILRSSEIFEETNSKGSDYYMIMEYAEDLVTHIGTNGISESMIVKIGIDICTALESCKKHNIIHNDIKPSNIFYNGKNYILGDFGNSTIGGSNTSVLFGTPNYLSPEVFNNQYSNETSDIYSLGIVMYKLLTGYLPVENESTNESKALEIRMSGAEIKPVNNINQNLMNVIIKACKYNQNERYQNATELKMALSNITNLESKTKKIEFTQSQLNDTISIYDQKIIANQTKVTKAISLQKQKTANKMFLKKYIERVGIVATLSVLLIIGIFTYMFNRECDMGYINRNGRCVKGYYYCDKGFTLTSKNKCQRTIESIKAKVTYTCQNGYTLKDDVCVNTNVLKPSTVYKCADSFRLNGKKCQKEESIDAIATYTCPSGYVVAGDQCVTVSNVTASSSYICKDSSYTLKGNICTKKTQKKESATITYYCNQGGTLSGNKCSYTTDPTGYFYYGNTCTKGTYSYVDRKCHYTENAKVKYTCRTGSTNDGAGSCISTVTEQEHATVKYTCPKGYTAVGAQCAKTTNKSATKKYKCPDGAKLVKKKCVSTISADAISVFVCPDGYIVSNSGCIMKDYPKAVKKYSCSRVYTLNGNRCEKYEKKSPIPVYTE